MSTVSNEEMQSALQGVGITVSSSVLDKCKNLCNQYSFTAAEFVSEVDAFRVNAGLSTIDLSHLGKIEGTLRTMAQERKSSNRSHPSNARPPATKRPYPDASPISNKRMLSPGPSPQSDSDRSSVGTASPGFGTPGEGGVSKYLSRQGSGTTVSTLNEQLPARGDFKKSTQKPGGLRVRVGMTDPKDFDNTTERYRYMFTPLNERSIALDKYMLNLQRDMTAAKGMSDDDLQPVGCPAPEVVWVSGRICCDAAEGKINGSSLVLEGSRNLSNGRRVHLDIRNLQSYALFPGQIVLAEGVMNSVQRMSVQSIVTGIPKPLPMSSPSKLFEYHHSPMYQGGRPVSVMCAAGPFTPADSLNYDPFLDIFRLVLANKPDVLVLTGPFVDMSQSHLANGETRATDDASHEHIASYEMMFIEKILRDGLGQYFNYEGISELPTQIILVPSLLDGHHDYVYPQPPFGTKKEITTGLFGSDAVLGKLEFPYAREGRDKRIHLMPNPCMFSVNETLFGVTSNDVLFSLSADEVSQNAGNRMARLAEHILEQQSFSPMFPAPAGMHPQADFRHSNHWTMKTSPDVLLIPSKLSTLAKEVRGTLVVNPGQLVKGSSGGTYATLTIHPIPEQVLRSSMAAPVDEQQPMLHNVHSRTKVEIVKI